MVCPPNSRQNLATSPQVEHASDVMSDNPRWLGSNTKKRKISSGAAMNQSEVRVTDHTQNGDLLLGR